MNIDSNFQQVLKEVHYLQRPPLEIRLPDLIRSLMRNTDPAVLQANAARLSTVVSQYNKMIRIISDVERPLFETKLSKIDQVFLEASHYCRMKRSSFVVIYWLVPSSPLLSLGDALSMLKLRLFVIIN